MPRIARRGLGLAAALCCGFAAIGGLAPAAGAEPTHVAHARHLAGGPFLAGNRLAWLDATRTRFAIRSATAGAKPDVLGRGALGSRSAEDDDLTGEYSYESVTLAASSGRVAYTDLLSSGNSKYQQGTVSMSAFSGPPGGPLGSLRQCSSGAPFSSFSAALAVDGSVVASVACDGRAVVRDFTPGAAVPERAFTMPAGSKPYELALTGRYLAYRYDVAFPAMGSTGTVVRDWKTGQVLYNATTASDSLLTLLADGTLVALEPRDSCKGVLSWHSRTAPARHILPVQACRGTLAGAGDRVAVVLGSDSSPRTLSLISLAGGRTDIAGLGSSDSGVGGVDYDGLGVAYAIPSCRGGADLFRGPAVADTSIEQPGSQCPVTIGAKRIELKPGRKTFRVPISCEEGCAGPVRATRRGRTAGRAKRLALAAGGCKAAKVKLRPRVRSALAAQGAVRVKLVVRTRDRDGDLRRTVRKLRLVRDAGAKPSECA